VTIGAVSAGRFVDLLMGARLVVVPIAVAERSAGQQTYLNAMAAGKPVIVTDAPGVRDYVEHGVTGLIAAPTAGAIRQAITWVLDPANVDSVAKMATKASEEARSRFAPQRYRSSLVDLCEELLSAGPDHLHSVR
jgi:glycosyltransferase involved in cell wall biosynthesis